MQYRVKLGLQIGAALELAGKPEGLHIRFLHEVLRVSGVPCQPHGRTVEAVDMLQSVVVQMTAHRETYLIEQLMYEASILR